MAEAVGFIASVTAILQLTDKVIKYCGNVKGASQEKKILVDEIQSVKGLLHSLQSRANRWKNIDQDWAESTKLLVAPGGPLSGLEKLLRSVEEKLANDVSGGQGGSTPTAISAGKARLVIPNVAGKIKDAFRGTALVWPFTSVEITKSIDAIGRYKSWIQLALENDHLELARKIHQDLTSLGKALEIDVQEGIKRLGIGHKEILQSISNVENSIDAAITNRISQPETSVSIDIRSKLRFENQDFLSALQWLSPLNFLARQLAVLSLWEEGTGTWMLGNNYFQKWLSGDEKTILCLGMPGAGKSVLASMITDYLQKTMDNTIGIAIVYLDYKEEDAQTVPHLIGSIISQLGMKSIDLASEKSAAQVSDMQEAVIKLHERHGRNRTSPSIRELTTLLLTSVLPVFSRVYLVVDALDECQRRDEFLEEINKILKTHDSVSLLATSRDTGNIRDWFASGRLVDIRASEQDVRQYLRSEIQRRGRLLGMSKRNPSLAEEIIETIAQKADGMFLLAKLHIERVASKHNAKQIRDALAGLPDGLLETYTQAMERISSQQEDIRKLALNILTWVIYSLRRLTAEELQYAVALAPGMTDVTPDDITDIDTVLSVCAGLVVLDGHSNEIRLVHFTAQEYFTTARMTYFPNGHTDISSVCLTHLFDAFPDFDWIDNFLIEEISADDLEREYPLLEYAVRFWNLHIQYGEGKALTPLVLQYLSNRRTHLLYIVWLSSYFYDVSWNDTWEGDHGSGRYRESVHWWTLLEPEVTEHKDTVFNSHYDCAILSVCLGLGDVFTFYVENGYVDTELKHRDTPIICVAASLGHHHILEMLIFRGVNSESRSKCLKTPLWYAAEGGHEGLVQLLLSLEAHQRVDGASADKDRMSPLIVAARQGYDKIVEMLLCREECLEKINQMNADGDTALAIAASAGRDSVVKILLSLTTVHVYAAPFNVKGQTPLIAAADGFAVGTYIVELLLLRQECIETVNHKDSTGKTALHYAVENLKEEVVRALLSLKGGLVYAAPVDNKGRTPLIIAVQSSACTFGSDGILLYRAFKTSAHADCDINIVRALLSCQECLERINHKDTVGRTALHYAVETGKTRVVRALLSLKAEWWIDVVPVDEKGRTPFMEAVFFGDLDIMQLLLSRKECLEKVNHKDNEGRTAMHYAAKAGHQRAMKALLSLGKRDVYECAAQADHNGSTPLMEAARHGHPQIVKLLLCQENCRQTVNNQDNQGYTALAHAVKGVEGYYEIYKSTYREKRIFSRTGNNGVIKLLLSVETINIHTKHIYSKYEQCIEVTPFFHAVLENHVSTVSILMSHRDKDALKNWFRAFPGISDMNKNLWGNICTKLVENGGCNLTPRQLHDEFLAEFLIFLKQSPTTTDQVIKEAFGDYVSEIKYMNKACESPLTFLMRRGYTELVRHILDISEISHTIRSHPWITRGMLVIAASQPLNNDAQEILNVLLSWKTCRNYINYQLGSHGTALHGAIGADNIEAVRKLLSVETINLGLTDDGGNTPLMAACREGNVDIVKLLFTHRDCLGTVNVRNESSNVTALSIAKEMGHDDIVEILIQHGAGNIDTFMVNSNTAIQ